MFQFKWGINQSGYCWVEAIPQHQRWNSKAQPRWFLTAREAVTLPRWYSPLGQEKLFRQFAHTSPTKEGILKFANDFGMLGWGSILQYCFENIRENIILNPQEASHGPARLASGESLTAWVIAISVMRHAVTLWDMVQKQDVDGLSAHVQWDKDAILYDSHPALGPIDSQPHGFFSLLHDHEDNPSDFRLTRGFPINENHREFLQSGFRRAQLEGNVIYQALYCVQSFVNEHIKEIMLARLERDADRDAHVLHVDLTLLSLWNALWYQFDETISQMVEVARKCKRPGCSVILENPRANKDYCSKTCYMKAYRKGLTYRKNRHKAEHL